MEKILKYSVLRYSPSIVSGESINLGILYSDEATGFHSFRFTHRLNRVLQFDDTLSKEKLLNILEGIETTVSEQKDDFDIDKYIKYYINSYRFERTQIKDINVEEYTNMRSINNILKERISQIIYNESVTTTPE